MEYFNIWLLTLPQTAYLLFFSDLVGTLTYVIRQTDSGWCFAVLYQYSTFCTHCTGYLPTYNAMLISMKILEITASWSGWSLGECSVTCGEGTRTDQRTCSSGDQLDCPGDATRTSQCSICPRQYHAKVRQHLYQK